MSAEKVSCNDYSTVRLNRIYSNSGNQPLIEMLTVKNGRILDVGCGAGDNAAIIRQRLPSVQIDGITHSAGEAELASRHMSRCLVFDIEGELPADLATESYDVLIFSHILEHLRDPASVLAKFEGLLRSGGKVLIAVPNVLSWRMRVQFLMGRFEYQTAGVLDDTHLRFFTYFTSDKYLLSKSNSLVLVCKFSTGGIPLWLLRRYIFPKRLSEFLDKFGCHHCPNLFGDQVIIEVIKK